jgi:3-oxoadipate enol-lactonase/4-carboxymuconolactone decarboxylase
MPFAVTQGARLYWRIEGAPDLPVLFLLNSIGTDMSLWDPMAPLIAGRFRLLRMDARGHGASDAPAGDYGLEDLAADALAVMDAAGVETAAVCGLSLGGMTAMTMALRAPERLWALVCACTSGEMDSAAWRTRVEMVRAEGMAGVADLAIGRFFAEDFARAHPGAVATVRAGLLAMSPDGYAGCGAAIRDMNLLGRLGEINVPTLVIAGAKDISTPFEGHGALLVAKIPGASARMLKTGHLACLEDPGAFAGAVVEFLSRRLEEGRAVEEARDTLFEAGLRNRRAVLGDAWVAAALANRTPFNAEFQAMITRYAWHEIWGRPGLDHRTRRLLVIAITAALGRWEEFRLHVRAGLGQGGFTESDLKEALMQTAIYAGVPAANTAFTEAARVIAEMTETR